MKQKSFSQEIKLLKQHFSYFSNQAPSLGQFISQKLYLIKNAFVNKIQNNKSKRNALLIVFTEASIYKIL